MKRWSFLVLPLPLLLTYAANAENLQDDPLFTLSLNELMEIEVSGPTRTLQKLSKVPASVTVFQRHELKNMGIDFLYELINYVPGFQTSRDNDYGATYFYSSRGSDTGQDTTAILLLVDGIPRQEIRNASASALSSLFPLDRIERIEVIRGPGSALYGSGAFLGVINIVSVQGKNRLKVQMGEPDRTNLEGQLSLVSGDWKFDGFLYDYRDKGDQYWLDDKLTDELKPTTDPQQVENYVFSLGYRDTKLTLERLGLESQNYYSIAAINNDFNELSHILQQVTLKQDLHWDAITSTLQMSYGENRQNYNAQATVAGQLASISNPSSTEPLYGYVRYEVHEWLLQWLNDWSINANNSLQFGAEKHHEHITEARVLSNYDSFMLSNRDYPVDYSAARDIYNEVVETGSREIYGLYAQWQNQFSDLTTFTMGGRYDDYEGFDGQFSMRLAITHELLPDHYVKLFYGEAFRAPSINQLNLKESLTVSQNPDLEAETIRTTEIVWFTRKTDYSYSISAFYNVIDDLINSSGFLDGKRTNVNEDTEFSSGVEIETSFQLNRNWLFKAGLTKFYTLPESATRESDFLASLIINYQQENWWINLSGYYNNEREMPLEEYGEIDAFTMLNSKIGFKLANDITASFQIKNLLDEEVASSPQNTSIYTPIPYRGREFSIGLEANL